MKHDYTDLKPKDEPSHTVIHHYEEDRTELERWLRGLLNKGPGFWAGLLGALLGAVALLWFFSRSAGESPENTKAWTEFADAKSADQQAEIAEDYPNSKAVPWVQLRAALANFEDGVERLPTSQDAARPLLAKAQEQFEAVLSKVPRDSFLARRAAFGLARTLEVRNDTAKAIAQYDTVVQTYAGTLEANQARTLAEILRAEMKKPDAERFYNKLYAYKAPEMTLPPGASTTLPGFPPSLTNPSGGTRSILDLLGAESGASNPATAPAKGDLPENVFTPELKAGTETTPPPTPEKPKAPPADPGGGILPPPPVTPKP